MLVNIITIAVVIGFKRQVEEKIVGFGSHAVIMDVESNSIFEAEPLIQDSILDRKLSQINDVQSFSKVGYKPAILQSDVLDYKDSQSKEIQGVVLKGIDESYDFSFIKSYLIEGKLPDYTSEKISDEILISKRIAKDLNYKVGDRARAFVVKSKPLKKIFKIVGIYETGLEELDKQIVFTDLRQIQILNDWGFQVSLSIKDTLHNGKFLLMADVIGGSGKFTFDWGDGFGYRNGYIIDPYIDTTYSVTVRDEILQYRINDYAHKPLIQDKSSINIKVLGNGYTVALPKTNSSGEITKEFLDEIGNHYRVKCGQKELEFIQNPGKGSFDQFFGAYELAFKELNADYINSDFKMQIELDKDFINEGISVTSIFETQQDIFSWLSFLDINVYIIIILMLLIGTINIGSAILVLILTKIHFIGLFKALGSTNWMLRKIFLIQAGKIVLQGMFWGNLVGVGFCILQSKFKIIKLNPEVYYLNSVPVDVDLKSIILLNIGTFIVCIISLLLPSIAIIKVNPIKSLKF